MYSVGGRLASVILIVQIASQLEIAALRGRHPKVGAAGIKDDLERLCGSPEADLAVILWCAQVQSVSSGLKLCF